MPYGHDMAKLAMSMRECEISHVTFDGFSLCHFVIDEFKEGLPFDQAGAHDLVDDAREISPEVYMTTIKADMVDRPRGTMAEFGTLDFLTDVYYHASMIAKTTREPVITELMSMIGRLHKHVHDMLDEANKETRKDSCDEQDTAQHAERHARVVAGTANSGLCNVA